MFTIAKYEIESNAYNRRSTAKVVRESRRGRDGFWEGDG